jgi:hypothetical protein
MAGRPFEGDFVQLRLKLGRKKGERRANVGPFGREPSACLGGLAVRVATIGIVFGAQPTDCTRFVGIVPGRKDLGLSTDSTAFPLEFPTLDILCDIGASFADQPVVVGEDPAPLAFGQLCGMPIAPAPGRRGRTRATVTAAGPRRAPAAALGALPHEGKRARKGQLLEVVDRAVPHEKPLRGRNRALPFHG